MKLNNLYIGEKLRCGYKNSEETQTNTYYQTMVLINYPTLKAKSFVLVVYRAIIEMIKVVHKADQPRNNLAGLVLYQILN